MTFEWRGIGKNRGILICIQPVTSILQFTLLSETARARDRERERGREQERVRARERE